MTSTSCMLKMVSSIWERCLVLTSSSPQLEILIFQYSSTTCMKRVHTCFHFMVNRFLAYWAMGVRCNKMGKWSDGLINVEALKFAFFRSWRKWFIWWRWTLKSRFYWSVCEFIMENFSTAMITGWNQVYSLSLTIPMSWKTITLVKKI